MKEVAFEQVLLIMGKSEKVVNRKQHSHVGGLGNVSFLEAQLYTITQNVSLLYNKK